LFSESAAVEGAAWGEWGRGGGWRVGRGRGEDNTTWMGSRGKRGHVVAKKMVMVKHTMD
jgi:hypothetical protein